jgi:hypothetical protein
MFNQFLTIGELLVLRKTCNKLHNSLHPNNEYMIMYFKHFGYNIHLMNFWPIANVQPLQLNYFLNQNYIHVLQKMEMLHLKRNQYALYTFNKNVISWHNEQDLTSEGSQFLFSYQPPKIYNKGGTAWAQITNEGNVINGGNEYCCGDLPKVQSLLKNVKISGE